MKQQPSELRKGDALVGKSASAIRAGALAAELAAARRRRCSSSLPPPSRSSVGTSKPDGLGAAIPDAAALQSPLG